MKNIADKLITIVIFLLFAIPIPVSLVSIPFSLINIGSIFIPEHEGINSLKGFNNIEIIEMILFIIVMILAGAYSITYIISLIITLKRKAISLLTFLPILHFTLFGILFLLVNYLAKSKN